MKIAVCDDEKNIRAYLSALVRKQGIECEVTEYASPGDYFSSGAEYDILFLDIELVCPEPGMDGIGVARQIRGMENIKQPVIIFVTGYEKYVYDAFDVGAFQYLLKPVNERKFAEVFQRAVRQAESEAEQGKKALVVQYGSTGKTILLNDIYYMESQNHKIAVHFKGGVLEYYAKIGDLERELEGQFCRIHKGYLINLSYVDEYSKKYFVEQQQVHAIQERMEEVEQFYDGICRMKHEMRNHLTNIKGLFESGNFGEMEQYIARLDEGMDVFELSVRTGNAVTDVIVNDKQKAAGKQGTDFQSEFTYPKSERYNAYDIGIIVNNLLQNALEACGKMQAGGGYIFLSSRQKKKFFLINVRNSFDGEIVMDADTNLPISTKGNKAGQDFLHGIGLSNVKREAEKYMGDVDIKVKKNEFSVTVMLQERRQA